MEHVCVDLTVYSGRPADARPPREEACYDLLDRLMIAYRRVDHEPAETMEMCEVIETRLEVEICKNLFLCNRQQTAFYLLVMPARKSFQTKLLTGQLGCARLSFAPPARMEEMIGAQPGSASVLGLQFDTAHQVQLVIDRDVLTRTQFACHPCRNTTSLGFAMTDLIEKLLPALEHAPAYVTL